MAARGRIAAIVGTRPEAIKMAPVARAIAARPRLSQQLVLTNQHRGLARYFDLPGEAVRELPFDPRGRTAVRLREGLHALLCGHFQRERIDMVLVQGDTASAFAGALAAKDCGIAIGHVEAGLRSFDLNQPWPEEGNRLAIDALSDLLFAPTPLAANNLRQDWRVKGEVHVTGNSGIDALFQTLQHTPAAPKAEPGGRKTMLVTCHRQENQGAPMRNVCAAVRRIAATLPVEAVVPLHTSPHTRRVMEGLLTGAEHVRLVEPLDYAEMVALMARSWLILTDSGGLQEEGPALGKPVLVLRNVTERAEALATDNIALIGTDADRIVAAVASLHADAEKYASMSRRSLPFGDGRAAPRIAAAVERWLAGPSPRRA